MTKITDTAANSKAREQFTEMLQTVLIHSGLEVVQIASHKVAFPFKNEAGNDFWAVVTVSVPKGSRDGEAFDGIAEAEDFQFKLSEKAKQVEKRKAEREAKAKAKAKK